MALGVKRFFFYIFILHFLCTQLYSNSTDANGSFNYRQLKKYLGIKGAKFITYAIALFQVKRNLVCIMIGSFGFPCFDWPK